MKTNEKYASIYKTCNKRAIEKVKKTLGFCGASA
jgi:hypothetical protein